jgi:hypothetical protein
MPHPARYADRLVGIGKAWTLLQHATATVEEVICETGVSGGRNDGSPENLALDQYEPLDVKWRDEMRAKSRGDLPEVKLLLLSSIVPREGGEPATRLPTAAAAALASPRFRVLWPGRRLPSCALAGSRLLVLLQPCCPVLCLTFCYR